MRRPLLYVAFLCMATLVRTQPCSGQEREDAAEGPQSSDVREALVDSIGSLRRACDFQSALEAGRELLRLSRVDSLAPAYEVDDAERLVETLILAVALPAERQRALARADSLEYESEQLWQAGRFADGVALLERELLIRRDVLGHEHCEVATTLNNLAAMKASLGDHDGAQALYSESLDLKRSILGVDHPEVALAVNNAASLKYSLGNYAAAEDLFREALGMLTNIYGEDDPFTTAAQLNLAGVMSARGDYDGAEPLYRKALSSRLRVLGRNHPQVAAAMNSLAGALKARGDYVAAEPLYREALAIRRRELGASHPAVAQSLNNLAGFLYAQGRYGEAEPLFREALELRKAALGERHPQVAQGLNNLAAVLYAQEDYAAAESLYEEALEMRRELLGDEHPSVLLSLYNLGVLQKAKGDYDEALATLSEAYRKRCDVLGEEHPDTATNLYNLAETTYLTGDCAGADTLYRRSLAVRRASLGPTHPNVVATLRRLGIALKACGDYLGAESALEQACRAYDAARLRAGTGASRATFAESPYADLAQARLELGKTGEAWPPAEKALARTLTDLIAASSARHLTEHEVAKEDSLSARLADCERELAVRRRAADAEPCAESSSAVQEARTALLEAESAWSEFQKEMSERYGVSEGGAVDLGEVQAGLSDDACIVGWVDAEVGPDVYDSWGYVVRSVGPVFWARLGRSGEGGEPSILDQFKLYLDSLSDEGSTALGLRVDAADLWAKRFAPLVPALDGARDLCLVASGASIGVPLETLVDEGGALLGERYSVSYVPSSTVHAWLTDGAHRGNVVGGALLLGDPPFEGLLPQLPGTRDEVSALAGVVHEPIVLVGPDASEESLVRFAETGRMQEMSLLHLATHAHVDDRVPGRSALVLSQAGLPDPVEAVASGDRVYDGFLTAREIVREWHLRADLVTLSACQTALGREVGGEGYLGLAHAFMQAGARSLLVSLWKVEDEATALLMRRFYENLRMAGGEAGRGAVRRGGRGARDVDKADALREAKLWLRDYVDETGRRPYGHPFFWSAFVLLGDRS